MNGLLIIDKPRGWTSHDVVNRARHLLREKRIGHTGTLDPLATGVLVLCVGKATRIARYLESDDKVYRAEMRLGVCTDTQDADGQVVATRQYAPPAQDDIRQVLREFTGSLLQRPPAYSAVKVGGVPSYRLARTGQAQEHAARPVMVHSLELLQYTDPLILFRVHCSKGTYVRTLCADMGERLGCGAHLTALTRERAGRFCLDDAISLERLAELVTAEAADGALVTLNDALAGMPSLDLTAQEITRISHGNPVPGRPAESRSPVRLVGERGELVAIGVLRSGLLWPETVLR